MQQAGEGRLDQIIVDPLGEPLDAAEHRSGQAALRMRLPGHEQQAVVAEERHPGSALGIGLGQRPDQRVARIAEPLAPGGMQPGDQLAGVALDARA